jgi:hypothetical protein
VSQALRSNGVLEPNTASSVVKPTAPLPHAGFGGTPTTRMRGLCFAKRSHGTTAGANMQNEATGEVSAGLKFALDSVLGYFMAKRSHRPRLAP